MRDSAHELAVGVYLSTRAGLRRTPGWVTYPNFLGPSETVGKSTNRKGNRTYVEPCNCNIDDVSASPIKKEGNMPLEKERTLSGKSNGRLHAKDEKKGKISKLGEHH